MGVLGHMILHFKIMDMDVILLIIACCPFECFPPSIYNMVFKVHSVSVSILFLYFACITIATSAIFSFHGFYCGQYKSNKYDFYSCCSSCCHLWYCQNPRNKLWMLAALSIIGQYIPHNNYGKDGKDLIIGHNLS